jgi:hypothetical protein
MATIRKRRLDTTDNNIKVFVTNITVSNSCIDGMFRYSTPHSSLGYALSDAAWPTSSLSNKLRLVRNSIITLFNTCTQGSNEENKKIQEFVINII